MHSSIFLALSLTCSLHNCQLKYPAPGAPHVAKRVKELLQASGFSRVDEDRRRGLDHGAWVPLMLMYPEADIPVCQLSVSSHRDGTYHYNLGKALAPLKDEGVLVIGSGSAIHNLRAIGPRNSPAAPWAVAFDSWLKNSLVEGRYVDVNLLCFPHSYFFMCISITMLSQEQNWNYYPSLHGLNYF